MAIVNVVLIVMMHRTSNTLVSSRVVLHHVQKILAGLDGWSSWRRAGSRIRRRQFPGVPLPRLRALLISQLEKQRPSPIYDSLRAIVKPCDGYLPEILEPRLIIGVVPEDSGGVWRAKEKARCGWGRG